ncbi:MAG: peptidoglycan DD-metalloendopeptidase family protein [Oscillospiraceae bacterium]
MEKRSNGIGRIFGGAGFYIALLLSVAAVGVVGYFTLFAPPVATVAVPPVAETPERRETPETVVRTMEPSPVPVETPVSMPVAPVVPEAPVLIVSPLAGETVTAFSMTELLYDETMADWRTHDGIDIAAKAGTVVLSAAGGTVETVCDDYLMGTMVVLSHPDGYQTVYANLQAQPNVKAGDKVTAGQVIGAVGQTSIAEQAKPPHLHFSVTCNGKTIDPNEYLKKG